MPSVDATAAGADAATAAGTAGRPAAGEAPLTDGQRERLQVTMAVLTLLTCGLPHGCTHSTHSTHPTRLCLQRPTRLCLQRVFEMYDAAKLGAVGEGQLRSLLEEMGLHPAEDAGEACRVEELFSHLEP